MLRINTILFRTNKYYNVLLERKMQVESESQKRVTTIDSYLIQQVDQIHNVWEKNKKNNSFIHRTIRRYKILCNTPCNKVDFVCIPFNVSRNFIGLWLSSSCTVGVFVILIPLEKLGFAHKKIVEKVVKKFHTLFSCS